MKLAVRKSRCAGPEEMLVAPLPCFSHQDLERAGGKGANLGELIQAGFPVPPGFVITTAAYDRVVAENGLETIIAGALAEDGDGRTIRAAFEAAEIPAGLEREILLAYQQLGQGPVAGGQRSGAPEQQATPVAVRSSATAEDLPEAAFAGQQDSFLNVLGEQALVEAVRRCWASLWTDRAIAYRARQATDPQAVKLAVVVQSMVEAEAAGVLFTAHPVTGARDEIVIDSNPGLGEAVVSGLVTPDHLVLRRGTFGWRIAERREGRREVIVQARPNGGTERLEGQPGAGSPALPEEALLGLLRLGLLIERHFGYPQDIEWAWSRGQIFIVQARPMTALPEPLPGARGPVRMLSALFAEMFPVRPYPLDMTIWIPALSAAAVEPLFGLLGIAAPPIHDLFIEEEGVVVRFRGKVAFRPRPAILVAPVRLLLLARRYDPAIWQADPLIVEARSRARLLETLEVRDISWEFLLDRVPEATALVLPLAGEPRQRYLPRPLLAAGLLRMVLGLLGQGDLFGALLSGVESDTVKANRALEDLAARVRSDAALGKIFAEHEADNLHAALEAQPEGRAFLDALRIFLDRYGHREVVLSTALQPTWKDAPEILLGILKGFAQAEPRKASGRAAWEVAQEELLAHPLLRFSRLRSTILGLLRTARFLWQIREDTHFNATMILPTLRRSLLECGQRLASLGILDAPEEVFHLKMADLEGISGNWPPSSELAGELRALVERRKAKRAALANTPLFDPRLFPQTEKEGEALLSGTPGSPGVAEGPARIIREAAQFGRLRPGEVLVAPYTNPAWTPLFQRAVAVVVDAGASGSHAAIVAREYGIPAVMGTVTGTQTLQDGEWVRVDGNRGAVLRADQPAHSPASVSGAAKGIRLPY